MPPNRKHADTILVSQAKSAMSVEHGENAYHRQPIAVIGLGCWYPGSRNPLQLWENILSRRLEFRTIPDCRLPLSDYCDPTGNSPDKIYSQRAAVIDGFEFDWIKRRIPKSMFESTDLVHWLSVEVAEQALRDAGYSKETLDKNGTGVIIGNTLTGDITRAGTVRLRWPLVRRAFQRTCQAHGLSDDTFDKLAGTMEKTLKSVFAEMNPDTLAGGLANTIAGRVCNYFDLHGGGYIVDGACSSSLLAVCTAARALSVGDLNAALVGGVDISIDPFELVGFSRAGALSKGDMKVYDKAAAGFIPGEGCGFVMLKRLEDARRDGDRVYAVLRGWGISSDGKGGIMTPSSGGQALAIRRAYTTAGYSPADLDFLEGHGTGTSVGDVTELKGVHAAQTHPENGTQPLHRRTGMTSLKSIIGHTKAAAGIGAFIKATIAVNRRVLPPTGSCTVPNPVFNETCHSLFPLTHGEIVEETATVRAGVSAMGFGGINSHVTLESADAPNEKLAPAIAESKLLVSNQTSEIFVFTAASFAQLAMKIEALLETASQLSCSDLIDLSADLSSRANNTDSIRAALVAATVNELVQRLQTLSDTISTQPPDRGKTVSSADGNIWLGNTCDRTRVGFLFPGQGSQQVAMARKLVARFDWAREMVAVADRIQEDAGLPTISETVFADIQRVIDREQIDAIRRTLARTEIAQVAIVTISAIYSRYLETMGIRPVACGGHSLGELTALYQAGAFDFEALLKLVSLRGQAMCSSSSPTGKPGAMAALFCSRETANELIASAAGYAVVANINSPNQLVISGDGDTIAAIAQKATQRQISVVQLNVSNAFHSNYVTEASEILRQRSPVSIQPDRLDIDVFSCVDGQPVPPNVNLHDHLAQQIVERVDFVSLIQNIEAHCDLLIEVGPGNVLTKLTENIIDSSDVSCLPTASQPDVDCCMNRVLAKSFVYGVDVQWERLFESRLHRPFVPVGDRLFIKNPCENDFVELGDVEQLVLKDTSQNIADSASTEINTSFHPIETHHNPTENQYGFPFMMHNNEMMLSPVSVQQVDDGVEEILLDIIQERTGFPKETLTLDQRLLDDLNLDSIKAGDIVATAALQLDIKGTIEPANLGDATLADLVNLLRIAKSGGESIDSAAMPMMAGAVGNGNGAVHQEMLPSIDSAPEPMMADAVRNGNGSVHQEMLPRNGEMPLSPILPKPSLLEPMVTEPIAATVSSNGQEMKTQTLIPDWVRNFAVDFVQHRNVSEQLDISSRHFRVLYDPSHEYFIELLARRFGERGATASFETYDRPGDVIGQDQPPGTSVYTVAILPREIPMGSSREKLQRMIYRLQRAVATTKIGVNQQPIAGITFVEFGNGRFGTEGITDVERSGTAAFARALHLESPALQVRVVDFAEDLSDFLATDFITNEIASDSAFCDAAYDHFGRRFETRHRLLQPAQDRPLPKKIGTNDVILVTGGARGITAECAIALAQKTGASFALVGTSPHPAQSSGAAAEEIATTLQRFASLSGRCEYFSCDLTDEKAVRQLIAQIDATLGLVTGIIHGAGRNVPRAANVATLETAMAEVSPKVLGAANLLESLADRPLRCLVGLTSIIGVTGIPGNSWYAFSNEVLDLILRQYKARYPETLVRSISYSAWSEVGMGSNIQVEKNLRRMGVGMIPLQEGVARFIHAIEHDLEDVQMLVTGSLGGIDTWRPLERSKCTQGSRFIGDIINFEPGIAVTTRVKLDHQQDPYLQDHIYSGTCLFPAVLGMEAMAQVAAYLIPEQPMVIRIQNVDLPRPIIVPEEGAVTIEIHALAAEMNAAGETVVSVGIRTERTQFQQDHFAAEIVFGEPSVGAIEPEMLGARLDIDPQRDLYGGIMFQGPRFQRWGNTYHLERGLMRLDVMHSEATCRGEGVFGEGVPSNSLLTGDPFFRDVMLQSIQALIPQRIGLPLSIERIDFFVPAQPDGMESDRRLVTSKMNVIGDKVGENHICEVVVKDPWGCIREHMTGYRVKVLAINETYPTAEQLADLGTYDQHLFIQQMTEACSKLGIEAPAMMLKRMPELHKMNRGERHMAERPLMEATADQFLTRIGRNTATPRIYWLESGCPIVANNPDCKISLSHDDDYCMCIANAKVAGCDLAPVTSRSREQWESLLGHRYIPLLDQLISHGDCLDRAGTRIWAAVEAAKKSLDRQSAITLKIESTSDGLVSFSAEDLGDAALVTIPISLHRHPIRIVAIVAPKAMAMNSSNGEVHTDAMDSATTLVQPASSMGKLVPSQSKSAASKPLVPSQPNSATAPKPLVSAQPKPLMNGSSLTPTKPMPVGTGELSGTPRSQAQMLAMAKLATAAMSPDEAQVVDDPSVGGSAMASSTMYDTRKPAVSIPVSMPQNNSVKTTSLASPDEIRVIEDISAIHKWDGPQDQAVFEYKFPVTFKECAKKGKHVQMSQYADWMGLLRENALLYLCPEIADKLFDGLSGMSTNWTDIDVVGELMMGDTVIARFFREEMTDASINLVCDFCKLLPDGRLMRVAFVRQMTTWVALEGKSEPVKAAFPKFLADAFRKVAPRSSAPPQYMELMGSLGRLKLEQQKLESIAPGQPIVLWSEEFQTTSADSNIVQNLYHARYFNWQWRTSDLFLYHVVPHLVSNITSIGNVRELIPTSGRIDYFRDAFPFDRIRTELAVTRSTECAATFQFTHFRALESGELQKLAVGKQDVIWVRRTPAATATPDPFPKALREALQASAVMV